MSITEETFAKCDEIYVYTRHYYNKLELELKTNFIKAWRKKSHKVEDLNT